MYDPSYAVHHRVSVRQKELEGTSHQHTADLYAELVEYILRTYPDHGPLRSMALRNLASSLNDIIDHAHLCVKTAQEQGPEPSAAPKKGVSSD